jgi:hypothetical protein
MASRSVKLWWTDKIVNSGNTLQLLFGDREDTISAAKLLIGAMKSNPNLAMTKREMRFFAKELQAGKGGVKYSYHNFYTKLLRKMMELGFIDRNVLIWDAKRRKTAAVYQLKFQPIGERSPQGGFMKQAWQVSRGWNDLIQQRSSTACSGF